ncbi:unnamed protein product [Urochloa humidicola]
MASQVDIDGKSSIQIRNGWMKYCVVPLVSQELAKQFIQLISSHGFNIRIEMLSAPTGAAVALSLAIIGGANIGQRHDLIQYAPDDCLNVELVGDCHPCP